MSGLTVRFVANVKGEKGKRLEYPDDAIRGLSLRVTEAGVKSWALRYRTNDGRQRRLTLGGYPALGLAQARDEAQKALGSVATGQDVAAEKQAARRTARVNRLTRPETLAALWTIYEREVLPRKRKGTQDYQIWLWEKHLAPRMGATILARLDRATVRITLKEIGETAPTTANRALALVRHMLNVAVDDEYIAANPLAQMGALYEEGSRERVLNDNELRKLWLAIEAAPARPDLPVSLKMAAALKLLLLTVARPGDVTGLHAREIDIKARSWTIPGERFKGKRPHTIPLSPAAWSQLREIFGPKAEEWSGFAFPNARNAEGAMRRLSLSRAMQRIVRDAKIERATPHDLRRTGATCIASERIGAPPYVVTALLGHAAEGPAVSGVYNRHRYDKEKREALEAWAIALRRIVTAKKRAAKTHGASARAPKP